MNEPLSVTYVKNAMILLKAEQRSSLRLHEVYARLHRLEVRAGFADFLGNPFLQTALSILEKFSSNYRIKEAIKLLREAGEEAEKESKKKRR